MDAMDPFSDIDLDAAAVWLDGAWYTREALARRIREMIEAGDFRVSRPSQALERLEAALAASRVMAVRMPSALAEAVEATAARLERPAGHLVREAIAYYLAAAEAYVAQAEAAAVGASGWDASAAGDPGARPVPPARLDDAYAPQPDAAPGREPPHAAASEAFAAEGDGTAGEPSVDDASAAAGARPEARYSSAPPAQPGERPREGNAVAPGPAGTPGDAGEGERSA